MRRKSMAYEPTIMDKLEDKMVEIKQFILFKMKRLWFKMTDKFREGRYCYRERKRSWS